MKNLKSTFLKNGDTCLSRITGNGESDLLLKLPQLSEESDWWEDRLFDFSEKSPLFIDTFFEMEILKSIFLKNGDTCLSRITGNDESDLLLKPLQLSGKTYLWEDRFFHFSENIP